MSINGHDKWAKKILRINLVCLSLFISAYILGVIISYATDSYDLSLAEGREAFIVVHFVVLTVTVFVPLATYLEVKDVADRSLWIKALIYLIPIASVSGISDFTSFFTKPYTLGYYLLRISDDAAAAYVSVMAVYILYRYLLQLHDYVSRTKKGEVEQTPGMWLTDRPYTLIPILLALMAAYVFFPSLVTGKPPDIAPTLGKSFGSAVMDIYDAAAGLVAAVLLVLLLIRILRERKILALANYRLYRYLVIISSTLLLFHYADGVDMFLSTSHRVVVVKAVADLFKIIMAISSFLLLAAISSTIPESLPEKLPITDVIMHVLRSGGTVLVKHHVSSSIGEKWTGLARAIEEIINAARGTGDIGIFVVTRPLSPILRYVENYVFSLIEEGDEKGHSIRAVYTGIYKLGVSFPRELVAKEQRGLVFKVYEIELETPHIGYILDDIYRAVSKDTRLVIIIDNVSDIYALLGKAKMFNLLRYILSKAGPRDILVLLMTKGAQPRNIEFLLEGTADAVVELSD